MDLTPTIIPKSDMLNADDLIAGPITIKITAVKPGSAEQPVIIHYEGDNGHPYKPGKSMRRVLVAIWGKDGSAYVGRRLTLYCDPTVMFGPDRTGGIRISHASDIKEPLEIALTVKRGKRKPFIVEPMAAEQVAEQFVLPEGWDKWTNEERGMNRANAGLAALRAWWKTLSKADADTLRTALDSEWKPVAEAADQAKKKGAQ